MSKTNNTFIQKLDRICKTLTGNDEKTFKKLEKLKGKLLGDDFFKKRNGFYNYEIIEGQFEYYKKW